MTTDTHALETIAAAAQLDHEWDRRAIDWPLDEQSVVVEVGGYKGRWALQIAERYRPKLYVFEPQPWAAEVCRTVLGPVATVLPYALGPLDCAAFMDKWETDGCTLVGAASSPVVPMREIGKAFAELGLEAIDLMLVNIEGYEYTLIPHMLERGIAPRRLMVQMHSFAGDSDALRQALAAHYRLLWDYGDVLSAWERP